MAKQNDAGVYKLKNGNWAYRYVLMVNGVRKEVRKAKAKGRYSPFSFISSLLYGCGSCMCSRSVHNPQLLDFPTSSSLHDLLEQTIR